jgi:hypothetical protein
MRSKVVRDNSHLREFSPGHRKFGTLGRREAIPIHLPSALSELWMKHS